MKEILVLIAILLGLTANSQSIPIQLMVVDQNGFEMPNTQVKLRLTMRGDTSLTTGQYQEVHNVSTNDLGIVSVDLGEGVVTTNSQVLAFGLFTFGDNEPFIKTELDTTINPTQYQSLGWLKYTYPMVAQRALKADTANYLKDNLIYELNDAAAFNVSGGIAIPSSIAIITTLPAADAGTLGAGRLGTGRVVTIFKNNCRERKTSESTNVEKVPGAISII